MTYQPGQAALEPYHKRLLDAYADYCHNVSRRGMAMSIQSCIYIWWFCDMFDVRHAADLGSGFTSYVLRLYAAEQGDVTIVSVDDNQHWLRETARFIRDHDLDATNLYMPGQWATTDLRFDLIVYDYASGERREGGMRPTCDMLTARGAVLFDDAQNSSHHHQMANACRAAGLTLYDLYHETCDDFGRFAALGAP